jgi:hypothetical protein
LQKQKHSEGREDKAETISWKMQQKVKEIVNKRTEDGKFEGPTKKNQ